MTLSVLIPTFNRLPFWRDHRKLLDGLYAQSDPDFECVIVDDGSTDGTADWLRNHFTVNPPPFHFKLLRTKFAKSGENQSSGAADNVGFREVTGDVILHLDDDLAIGPDIVAYVKTLDVADGKKVVWGALLFSDKEWKQLEGAEGRDTRWHNAIRQHIKEDLFELPSAWRGDWGAVYAIATSVIREMGGHHVELVRYRSSDSRFGFRLRRFGLKTYLSTDPRMVTTHWGRSWFQQQRKLGKMDLVRQVCRSPNVNVSPTQLTRQANGGTTFWTSSHFDGAYDTVLASAPKDSA